MWDFYYYPYLLSLIPKLEELKSEEGEARPHFQLLYYKQPAALFKPDWGEKKVILFISDTQLKF